MQEDRDNGLVSVEELKRYALEVENPEEEINNINATMKFLSAEAKPLRDALAEIERRIHEANIRKHRIMISLAKPDSEYDTPPHPLELRIHKLLAIAKGEEPDEP